MTLSKEGDVIVFHVKASTQKQRHNTNTNDSLAMFSSNKISQPTSSTAHALHRFCSQPATHNVTHSPYTSTCTTHSALYQPHCLTTLLCTYLTNSCSHSVTLSSMTEISYADIDHCMQFLWANGCMCGYIITKSDMDHLLCGRLWSEQCWVLCLFSGCEKVVG